MRRLTDRFGEEARRCVSLEDLRELIVDAASELRFDHFALLHHSSGQRAGNGSLLIDNYPEEWVRELVESRLIRHDPVHLACRRAGGAFSWSELHGIIELGPEQRRILERSRYFGLGEGLTVPVNVPGEPSGSCSFVVRKGRELPRQRLLCAELVGAHAFKAARRLSNLPRRRSRPHLSPRELQCVRLVAEGKTDWEMAKILGISIETARQYVKSARTAYDSVTRAQLVAKWLRDEWQVPD